MIPVIAQQTGMVVGGWSYVWAAYVATWAFFGGYAASLWMRSREDR
jgi:hypothetical protein